MKVSWDIKDYESVFESKYRKISGIGKKTELGVKEQHARQPIFLLLNNTDKTFVCLL